MEVPDVSELTTVEPFGDGFMSALAPELILFFGLIVLILLPNVGRGTFRIRGTQIRLPWFLGGKRYKFTSDPRLPAWIATTTLTAAFLSVLYIFSENLDRVSIVTESGKEILLVNGFSRVFEMIFF